MKAEIPTDDIIPKHTDIDTPTDYQGGVSDDWMS